MLMCTALVAWQNRQLLAENETDTDVVELLNIHKNLSSKTWWYKIKTSNSMLIRNSHYCDKINNLTYIKENNNKLTEFITTTNKIE